ncbi:MAG: cytochrome c3 family protein [Candidatus Aminicenantes bacterium]|nr:cytochrome c3 family protein [Candidatus Aminicenantes bacterium]
MHRQMKPRKPLMKAAGIIGISLLFCVLAAASFTAPQESDAAACLECHEGMTGTFKMEAHGGLGNCMACHIGADKHMDEGGGVDNILAFRESDGLKDKVGACLTCHTRETGRYMASPHGKSQMDCTVCHSVHSTKPSLLKTSADKSCSVCHGDVMAQFNLNEKHRLQEGILSCVSCHNPHEPSVRERLGGFKQEACLKCHTDKGGPYLHEHEASRIEGCATCHEVHGSVNRHMLTYQSTADLCFSCHAGAPSWHSRFTSLGSNCTVCHSTIHGSNLSPIFLK